MNAKKGFTLLESLLVLTIAGITATMAVQQAQQKFQRQLATISGQQIRQIGKATDAYITHNYSDWPAKKGQNAPSLSTNQAGGPRQCYSDGTCQITIKTLVQNGYLPQWNPNLVNPLNSSYQIIIKKATLSNSTMPLLSSLVVTRKPFTPTGNTNNINYAMLGQALQAAGSQAGYSRNIGNCTSTSICGYGGSFQISGYNYHNVVTQSGQLGFYTGISQGFLNNQYLRRDGTLPMYGDLYMGEHDIYNVRRIQGSETKTHEPSPNNTQTNPRSSLRMGNIQVSTNPHDLPKINAKPQFATAANVPTLLKGNVSIVASKAVISKDKTPANNNFIAVFNQNPKNGQTAFEVGTNAKTTYNNGTRTSITVKGGLHFPGRSNQEAITRGQDALNASSGGTYDDNHTNYRGYNGVTPVNIPDSLSVAGVITNKDHYYGEPGVNIMDDNYIDLTSHNASTGGKLDGPIYGTSGSTTYRLSQGWVNIGGNNHSTRDQTGVTVKNGPVYVGGDNSCNYNNYKAQQICKNNGKIIRRNGKKTRKYLKNANKYPKPGVISAADYYVRNYKKHPNEPLSQILNNIGSNGKFKIYGWPKGVHYVRQWDFQGYIPKPNCNTRPLLYKAAPWYINGNTYYNGKPAWLMQYAGRFNNHGHSIKFHGQAIFIAYCQ